MRLLVLGGTRFVGRAVVEDALARGWEVTALNRGVTGSVPAGVTALLADRTSEPAFVAALGTATWDLVVDTWSGAPSVAGLAARVLTGRVRRYGYVSSESVYTLGQPRGRELAAGRRRSGRDRRGLLRDQAGR